MANSINNWLGFSLSPQDHFPSQDHSQNSVFNSGTQVSSECFDLTSDSTIPSLNLPAPFSILQDFQRNNHSQGSDSTIPSLNLPAPFSILQDFQRNNHSQDRNVKDVGLNSFPCSSQNLENQEEPKLENFLGVSGHTSNDQEHNNTISTDTYIYQEAAEATSQTTSDNNSMGLSMIKNWLRNNPAPPQAVENTGGDDEALQPLSVQTWSLSMSTGAQSSSHLPVTVNGEISTSGNNDQQLKNDLDSQAGAIDAAPRKSIDTFGQRTSIYRGVTRHRWTGRYEAHLWDNSYRREGQARKGRQVYLGGYDQEEKAARSYDLAALKYWGTSTTTNFPMSNYEKEIEEMKHMTRQEYVASLRRRSSGFSRGASIYRGVTRHHQHGRWQARIGRVSGNKDVYLGTFSTQEEAAEAYDIAAIKFRGLNAVTNFEISRYDVKSILESSTLQIGGAAKRLKDAEMALEIQKSVNENPSLHLTDGLNGYSAHHGWRAIAFQQAQPLRMNTPYPYSHQRQDPDVNQSFRDLQQLQLGNAQNFFQHSVLHNLMGLDSSSVEHSSGSKSINYSNNGAGHGNGTEGNFVAPMGNMIAQDEVKPLDNENMFGPGSWDPYIQERNFCYQSQQASSNGLVKAANVREQASTCDNWILTGVPNLAARPNNMAVCHGASTFTIWNQT